MIESLPSNVAKKLENLPLQKIDITKPVNGSCLDYNNYKAKLAYYVRHYKDAEYFKTICGDPTLFAYAFLRNDENQPMQLTAYQDAVACCALKYKVRKSKPNDAERYVLFRASNQIGKSHLEMILIILRFLTEKNINQFMITNRRELTTYLIRQIKLILDNSNFHDWRGDFDDSENATTITLTHKDEKGFITVNRICCAPAGQGGLGYPMHYLYLDECDFYDNGKVLFSGIFNPRTKKTKGQIFAISNPNYNIPVTESLLYDLVIGDMFRCKFHFNLKDAPWYNEEEFERDRRNTASYIFASTHLGEFSNLAGGFFTYAEIKDMLQHDWQNCLPAVTKPIYIALDLAKVKDNTVLTLGYLDDTKDKENPELHVKYVNKFQNGTDYTIVCDEVKRIVDYYEKNYYGVASVGYDATGVGNAVGEIMSEKGLQAEPVVFTMTSKSKMYANFKMLAEQRRIKIVYDEECEKQLSNLVFDKTSSGNLQIHNSKDLIHDDFPSSLAVLCHIALNSEITEPSLAIF